MKVVVEMLTGPLFNIEVGDDATVGDLKKQIASQQELPCDRLILILDLDNDQDNTIVKIKMETPWLIVGSKMAPKSTSFSPPLMMDPLVSLLSQPYLVLLRIRPRSLASINNTVLFTALCLLQIYITILIYCNKLKYNCT